MVSNFPIVTRIQTRSVQALETIANRPSRQTPPGTGEPRMCSAPQTVGGSDSLTLCLWWSQTQTGGSPYQQIKLHFSQSKVTLSAWDLDRLRSAFPLNRECSSLASRTLFANQYTFCHRFWGRWTSPASPGDAISTVSGFLPGVSELKPIFIQAKAALTGVLGTVSPGWTSENATVFTPPPNVCSSEMSG